MTDLRFRRQFGPDTVLQPKTAEDLYKMLKHRIVSRGMTEDEAYAEFQRALDRAVRNGVPEDELPDNLTSVEHDESDEVRKEVASWIVPFIEKLPEKYRQAVLMSEVQGLPQKEIAEELGISLSGAKSRIQRGRAMVKDILLDCCHLEFDRTGRIIDYSERVECCSNCSNEN